MGSLCIRKYLNMLCISIPPCHMKMPYTGGQIIPKYILTK